MQWCTKSLWKEQRKDRFRASSLINDLFWDPYNRLRDLEDKQRIILLESIIVAFSRSYRTQDLQQQQQQKYPQKSKHIGTCYLLIRHVFSLSVLKTFITSSFTPITKYNLFLLLSFNFVTTLKHYHQKYSNTDKT